MSRKLTAMAATYSLCALVAFGHSYNHDYEKPNYGDYNGFRALFSAIFWPLYVSKVAFEGVRP